MIDGLSLQSLPQLASGKQRGKYRDRDGVISATKGGIVSQWEEWRKEESEKGRKVGQTQARWLLVSSLIHKTDVLCCFVLFVWCPEIASNETVLHFSDCSFHSCGHRNAGCPVYLLPFPSVSPSIFHSSLLSFPHLCAYSSSSRSFCPKAMTLALLGNLWLTLRLFLTNKAFFNPLLSSF